MMCLPGPHLSHLPPHTCVDGTPPVSFVHSCCLSVHAAPLPAVSSHPPRSNPSCSRCLPLSPTATQQSLTSRTAAASVGASQGSSCRGCCTWGPLGVEACTGTQTHLLSQQKAMARPCQLCRGEWCLIQSKQA